MSTVYFPKPHESRYQFFHKKGFAQRMKIDNTNVVYFITIKFMVAF